MLAHRSLWSTIGIALILAICFMFATVFTGCATTTVRTLPTGAQIYKRPESAEGFAAGNWMPMGESPTQWRNSGFIRGIKAVWPDGTETAQHGHIEPGLFPSTTIVLRKPTASVQATADAKPKFIVPEDAPLSPPPSGWKRINIAVVDLEPQGTSKTESATLTDNLRSALVDTDYFQVVSRADMARILAEQNFQRTDACSDTQCLAEMGQVLSVDAIVGGSIGQVGGVYSFTLRMIDVESSKIVSAAYKDVSDATTLLPNVRELGRVLTRKYSTTR